MWEYPVRKTVLIKRAEAVHMPVEFTALSATVYYTSEKRTESSFTRIRDITHGGTMTESLVVFCV